MDWKAKVISATAGSQTGAIVACALGVVKDTQAFHGRATITSDGFVMCDFTDSHGNYHHGAFVGEVASLVRNVKGLAAHCGLEGDDRAAYFAALRKWIGSDWRSDKTLF